MSRSSELQRYADRYLGIPIVAMLGMLSVKRALPPKVVSIGLIQPTAIGDTILSSGLLAGLQKKYPNASLHLFHGRSNEVVVSLLDVSLTPHLCDFSDPLSVIRQIRRENLDILIDLVPWPRLTALIAYFSGARCIVGYRTPGQYRHWLYDVVVDHQHDRHELENLAAIREVLGAGGPRAWAIQRPAGRPDVGVPLERVILMHTQPGGSRAYAKCWPEEYWAEVARCLCDDGWYIGLTGAKKDEEPIESLRKRVNRPGRCLSLCDKLSFSEIAAALTHVPLLITVDTGILHLAAALNAQVLALHGPTASARWGARNSRSVSLDADHPSGGYIDLGFERHPDELEIMSKLTPQLVLDAARQVLTARAA